MAPPAGQRSGANKRAEMSLFAGYVLAGLGAALGALLLVLSLWRPEALFGLRSMMADIASPIGHAGAAGRVGTRGFFESIAGYYDAGSKNAELQREMEIARVKLAEARALAQENARLKAVIGMAHDDTRPVAIARLIGSTSSSTRRIAFLGAGAADGVRVGMPVTSPMGLVGRVLEAGRSSSRVLLLTDSESIVPVRRATDDVVAFAEGRADGTLRLRLINLGVNPLKEGDVFVTSGAGGMFRPGIAVAMVAEITSDGAIGQLLSNPAATDMVIVEQVWQRPAVRELSAIAAEISGTGQKQGEEEEEEAEPVEEPAVSADSRQQTPAGAPSPAAAPVPEVPASSAATAPSE